MRALRRSRAARRYGPSMPPPDDRPARGAPCLASRKIAPLTAESGRYVRGAFLSARRVAQYVTMMMTRLRAVPAYRSSPACRDRHARAAALPPDFSHLRREAAPPSVCVAQRALSVRKLARSVARTVAVQAAVRVVAEAPA